MQTVSGVTGSASDFLAKYGVDQGTIDTLIAEYENGGKWDSFSSESAPVSSQTQRVAGFDETVKHYADGSVAVTRAQVPRVITPGTIQPMDAVHGCTVSGNMRNNCQADMWVGVVSMGFLMSYNASTNTVTNVYGGSWSIGGACGSSQKYLGKPAYNVARLEVSASMCAIPYQTVFWLQATVSGGVANESWSA
ncbi:hypothetical protein ACFVWR_13275 [Leifsonia sp. NPDC058292]|uniref:hypothetical protein n=1 Tax=Leifsonia sp. NPDC058292 TaxID=3346428 RepID=UPI0036DE5120